MTEPRPPRRSERERAILSLIAERPVGTQQELVEFLGELGLEVTQATISRDIKRLGLLKVAEGAGYRYAAPGLPTAPGYVVAEDEAEAILILHTLAGRASAVACVVDELELPEVAATLAGDDTVLVLVRRREQRQSVRSHLTRVLGLA